LIGAATPIPCAGDERAMSVEAALGVAIDDEYKARATYREVLAVHGNVRPFSNVVEAEERHIDILEAVFAQRGLPVPPDPWPARVQAPSTVVEACEAAVVAERENVRLYDRLLSAVRGENDVETVFRRLQSASRDRHLPAFERCAGRARPGGAGVAPRGVAPPRTGG